MDLYEVLTIMYIAIFGYSYYIDWRDNVKCKYDVYSDRYWRDSYGDFDGQIFWNFMCRELDHVIICQESVLRLKVDNSKFDEYMRNIDIKLGCDNSTDSDNWKSKFNIRVNRVRLISEILRPMV